MGAIYRSELMSLTQIFLQTDAAYACVAELGEIGAVMFRDLNEDLSSYQRKFVNEVRRCDEMERKLRFIEEEILMDDVDIPDVLDHIRTPQPKDMLDLEATFEKIEEELLGINATTKTLRANHIQLWEMAQIIEKVKALLDMGHSRHHAATIISEQINMALEEGGYEKRVETELKFVTGVIKRDKVAAFEKFLWRMCRGKVFIRAIDCDSEQDVFGKEDEEKAVFILFFSGEQLASRLEKICKGFHARIYNCPEESRDREKLLQAIGQQLKDLRNVITRTLDHRSRVVNAASGSVTAWKIKVFKIKMIFFTLNMFSIDVTQKCLIAECWTPTEKIDDVRRALVNGTVAAGSLVHPVLHELETHDTPPTYFKQNKFTQGFQNIVDLYGVPTYREINPAPWSVISFPFIFACMFGDTGHGLIMLLAAIALVAYEKRIIDAKIRDEIFNIFFSGRYIILLMSIFSLYTGLIYNDFYSKSINLFGSSWAHKEECWTTGNMLNISLTEQIANKRAQKAELMLDPITCMDTDLGPYPFGVDPIWNIASNRLNFLNPMKMKMSIVIGILQMVFGLVLSLVNYIHRRSIVDMIFVFIPQMLFLGCIFIYLCIQIFLKWIYFSASGGVAETDLILGHFYPGSNCAPSLLIGLINMFMMKERAEGFVRNITTDSNNTLHYEVIDQCSLQQWYPNQSMLELIFLLTAVLSIPVMLFVKPCYVKFRHSRGWSIDEYVHHDSGAETEFSLGDTMVYQAIHTIEYVLGCISHTASYLRLWALSLAHAQLSEVLWTMLFHMALTMNGWVGAPVQFFIFMLFAVLTLGILILMEGLSAFLHALRLHWVEFMSKFYGGEGIAFEPFYFTKLIRVAEGLDD